MLKAITYWQEKIHDVHDDQDNSSDFGLVVAVAAKYKCRRDDVMREHLPVIFPPLFNVDNDDLLKPECELSQVVPFVQTGHGWLREVLPHSRHVEEVGRCDIDVLDRPSADRPLRDECLETDHANRDHHAVVCE